MPISIEMRSFSSLAFKIFISLSLVCSSTAMAADSCDIKGTNQQCSDATAKAQGCGLGGGSAGACGGANQQQGATDDCKSKLFNAATECNDAKKACDGMSSDCKKKCHQVVDSYADQVNNAYANALSGNIGAGRTAGQACAPPGGGGAGGGGGGGSGGGGSGGGGSGGGGAGMLGALAGLAAMAAMMAMQKQNQQQQQQQQLQPNGYASPDGVVGADGSLNCSANLAYRYSACNATISSACESNITNMMSSSICTQFSARYCNQGYTPPVVYSPYPYPLYAGEVIGNTVVTTPSPQYTVDQTGEGGGSGYCLRVLQINFCTNASNAQCPSCLQLASLTGSQCIGTNNPACIQVSSPQSLAQQMKACPNPDPLLTVTGTGATTVAGTTGTTTGTTTASGPPAVLPVHAGVNRNVASTTGGGGSGSTTRNVGEVGTQWGTSIFSANSQPIAQRCTAGQLLHCL